MDKYRLINEHTGEVLVSCCYGIDMANWCKRMLESGNASAKLLGLSEIHAIIEPIC